MSNKSCKKCNLWKGRTNVVCGVGCLSAKVMLVGEAPGKNEDEQGTPFVGAAGKQLDELLGEAGLSREQVYITNLVKCRPPKNRNPYTAEVVACAEYLLAEIAEVRPRVIVTLGNYPTRYLLDTKEGITTLHGKAVERAFDFGASRCAKSGSAIDKQKSDSAVFETVVYPVYHPAAAIYDRRKIDDLRADIKQLEKILQHEHDKILKSK